MKGKCADGLWAILLVCFVFASLTVSAQEQDGQAAISTDNSPKWQAVQLTEIARNFWRPHTAVYANDGEPFIYVVEQVGRIWIVTLQDNWRFVLPFLDVSHLLWHHKIRANVASEQGLLGLAFHPDYRNNGYFYISYSDRNEITRVVRYKRQNRDRADLSSATEILNIPQPHEWHNGGSMAFGPDGYLYISVGDGGFINDPLGSGQNLQTLLGSVLRINVDKDLPYSIPPDNPFVNDVDARAEIWAYGLRNVWGLSFDSHTGDLYFADVGQNHREELNFQPADSPGGENYGWNVFEGTLVMDDGAALDHTQPVIEYDHSQGCAIIGGHVYRGQEIPSLQGVFLYGDHCSGRISGAWRDETGAWRTKELLISDVTYLSGFGVDDAGEIYVLDYGGKLYRIEAAPGDWADSNTGKRGGE